MVGPRRILIAINTSWNIHNFRSGLIRALVAQGYEVVAAAPRDDYSERLAETGCRYVSLPMDNKGTSPLNDLLLTLRFWRLLHEEKPDIFLGYTIKPNIYGSIAARVHRIPAINNIAGLGVAFGGVNWLNRLVKKLYRIGLGSASKVFFQNDDDRRLFIDEKIVRPDVTALLPGSGIDLARFCPTETADRSTGADFTFLLVARLLWDKGIAEYVEAARLVRSRIPDARFQILGFLDVESRGVVPRDTMNAWIAEGIIEYLGVTDDVRPPLSGADCVVLPSYYREGTPRSLLEAAAMGRPIITTNWVGCRDVVDDGINGYLCRPRDASDLAAKMLAMAELDDQARTTMGRAGRAKMEREFDESIVVSRYLEAIQKILGRDNALHRLPSPIAPAADG
ncbi:glycosyltransferase [Aurantimonas aggregata]|uniref:Glycosyltransferase n=2 Tax=Aurantimonas aggregata TaxID=2047720 RepID=A0A6L9MMK1_9HYPH|nr:glycosyltransferase family 4 protein [Aurantimonas aggregata]NDV89043.1 glycosyltransferase [Aurantimonas aggregata]